MLKLDAKTAYWFETNGLNLVRIINLFSLNWSGSKGSPSKIERKKIGWDVLIGTVQRNPRHNSRDTFNIIYINPLSYLFIPFFCSSFFRIAAGIRKEEKIIDRFGAPPPLKCKKKGDMKHGVCIFVHLFIVALCSTQVILNAMPCMYVSFQNLEITYFSFINL